MHVRHLGIASLILFTALLSLSPSAFGADRGERCMTLYQACIRSEAHVDGPTDACSAAWQECSAALEGADAAADAGAGNGAVASQPRGETAPIAPHSASTASSGVANEAVAASLRRLQESQQRQETRMLVQLRSITTSASPSLGSAGPSSPSFSDWRQTSKD